MCRKKFSQINLSGYKNIKWKKYYHKIVKYKMIVEKLLYIIVFKYTVIGEITLISKKEEMW